MTNDVINGIVAALVAEFPGIPVHDEPVTQGIVEPSFSVRCIQPKRKLFRGNRYYQEGIYEVVYFPPMTNRYQNKSPWELNILGNILVKKGYTKDTRKLKQVSLNNII